MTRKVVRWTRAKPRHTQGKLPTNQPRTTPPQQIVSYTYKDFKIEQARRKQIRDQAKQDQWQRNKTKD